MAHQTWGASLRESTENGNLKSCPADPGVRNGLGSERPRAVENVRRNAAMEVSFVSPNGNTSLPTGRGASLTAQGPLIGFGHQQPQPPRLPLRRRKAR